MNEDNSPGNGPCELPNMVLICNSENQLKSCGRVERFRSSRTISIRWSKGQVEYLRGEGEPAHGNYRGEFEKLGEGSHKGLIGRGSLGHSFVYGKAVRRKKHRGGTRVFRGGGGGGGEKSTTRLKNLRDHKSQR